MFTTGQNSPLTQLHLKSGPYFFLCIPNFNMPSISMYLVPRPHLSPTAREGLVTLVHFLGPGSNIFPGMSGVESDWSDRQMLCNTNDATAIIN